MAAVYPNFQVRVGIALRPFGRVYSTAVSEEVFAAWKRGEVAVALDAALRAWRKRPAARIADAIEGLTEVALASDSPSAPATKDEFHAAWMAEARRGAAAVRTGWLASTLTKRLPIHTHRYGILRDDYASEKYASLRERVTALCEHGPDPRIATAFTDLIWRTPYNAGYMQEIEVVYGPILAGIVQQGDVRAAERLLELVEAPRAKVDSTRRYLATALPGAIAELEQRRVAPPADAERWLALAPKSRIAEPSAQEHELLESIYDDPDDDEARLVYADMLQTRGDPRGEFIALQMMPTRGEDGDKQVKSLFRKHRDEWLGDDLARVLIRAEFERGFLARAGLGQNAVTTEEGWQRASRDPRLATVEALEKGRGNATWYGLFVGSPAMRALRSIEIPTWAFLDTVAASDNAGKLRHLRLPRPPRKKQLAEIAETVPGVDALSVYLPRDGYDVLVKELIASELGSRLRSLAVQAWQPNVPPAMDVLESLARFPESLQRIAYLHGHARIELRRRGDELVAYASAHACSDMAVLLPRLPEAVTEVQIEGASEAVVRAVERAATERPGITLRVLGTP